MPTITRALIITGAEGYIGARLAALARAEGRVVVTLQRAQWRLGDALPAMTAAGLAMIHLAHDWRNKEENGVNLAGTRVLQESCRAAGVVRFVFVSSQSARADATNVYGRVKWRIEQALGANAVAARVGLVYGGRMRGQYGLLCGLTRRAPVLPMVDPWRTVQPIHLDEVCRGLLRLADGEETGWVGLAGAPVPFKTVLQALARELYGKRLRILPVPLRLALLACDVNAAVPFGPTVDRERVLGLAGTRTMDCAGHLAALGFEVVPIEVGLRRERASRKALLAEGRALLGYVLRTPPGSGLLRQYVRGLGRVGEVGALAGVSALRFEPLRPGTALGRRLALACTLAEASPEGMAALDRGSRAGRLGRIGLHLVADALVLPLRLLLSVRR